MKDFWSQSIKDQAYYIVVGFCGSWMHEALFEQMQDEEFCKNIVEKYRADYGDEVVQQIQGFYDDRDEEADKPEILEYEALPEGLKLVVDK
jgi:hypothetical protein